MAARNEELPIMARALATAMGRIYWPDDRHRAPVGAWFIERADTERPLYRLTEQLENGGIDHPISSTALSAQGLADALYFARRVLETERYELRMRELAA